MKLVSFAVISIFLCNLINLTTTARILGIFPSCGYSQFILGGKLLRELAAEGREVTVISGFPTKTPINNYTDVPVKGLADVCKGINLFDLDEQSSMTNIRLFHEVAVILVDLIFENGNVKQLLDSKVTFDLVICEVFFDYSLMAFAHHFKAQLVLLNSQGPNEWTKCLLHHPLPFVYVPFASGTYSYEMDTISRMKNFFDYLCFDIYNTFVVVPHHDKLIKKYLPNTPPVSKILPMIDLVLFNSHISSNLAVPLLPNMVEVGGFHVDPKPLPKDLQKFLDEAVDGVVYFSMGSNLRSDDFSEETRTAFFNTFTKLKQKVLWKFGDETVKMPKNVKIGKWLPQQDILAHPNMKLFITHGGLLSAIETVHFGVPVLSIPIFADQMMNAGLAEKRGMGLTLGFRNITEHTLTDRISKLLNDPRYAANAKFRSSIMRDQETKPLDRALFWIDYVIRHKGAKHLQVHGIIMPWWKYYAIDLVLIGLTVILALVLILRFIKGIFVDKDKAKIKRQ